MTTYELHFHSQLYRFCSYATKLRQNQAFYWTDATGLDFFCPTCSELSTCVLLGSGSSCYITVTKCCTTYAKSRLAVLLKKYWDALISVFSFWLPINFATRWIRPYLFFLCTWKSFCVTYGGSPFLTKLSAVLTMSSSGSILLNLHASSASSVNYPSLFNIPSLSLCLVVTGMIFLDSWRRVGGTVPSRYSYSSDEKLTITVF